MSEEQVTERDRLAVLAQIDVVRAELAKVYAMLALDHDWEEGVDGQLRCARCNLWHGRWSGDDCRPDAP